MVAKGIQASTCAENCTILDICRISLTQNSTEYLFLVPEPSNQYDKAAIMVQNAAGQKLGYVAKGFIQDITNDFICREDTIKAKISSKNKYGLAMDIELYRDGKGSNQN